MKKNIIYSLTHLTVDFSCAFILYRMYTQEYIDAGDVFAAFLLYNIIAFGSQFLLGFVSDIIKSSGRLFASAGCVICAAGLFAGCNAPGLSVVLMGIGNAAFHTGGGTDAVTCRGMSSAGIFVSSGALGVALGIHLGSAELMPVWYPLFTLLFLAALIAVECGGGRTEPEYPGLDAPRINGKYTAGVLLLIAILMRSWAGFAAVSPESESRFAWLLPAFAAFAGKLAGGILSDLLGPRITGTASVLLAAPLFIIGSDSYLFYLAALFFFNMAMPVTLCELTRLRKGREGFAFGLTTLALLGGYLINLKFSADAGTAKIAVPFMCVIAAVCIFVTASPRAKKTDA